MRTRRENLKQTTSTLLTLNIWSSPIIFAVSLPAHATTSFCQTEDISGAWQFTLNFHSGDIETFTFDFDDNDEYHLVLSATRQEIGEDVIGVIEFLNLGVTIDIIFDIRNVGEFCNILSGSFDNIAGLAGPESTVVSGLWTAEQIN